MIAVRPARDEDVAFLVATQVAPHARGFVLAATAEQVRAALGNPDRATFVLTEDGEPAGMLLLGTFSDAPWIVELRRVVVTRPGRGIGAHAVRWAIAHAFAERNAHRISLEVVATNDRARRLYERCGFVLEGTPARRLSRRSRPLRRPLHLRPPRVEMVDGRLASSA